MKRVYKCADIIEANALLHVLETAGIPCRIMNEFTSGALGDIPFTEAGPEIWIEDERDFDLARKNIEQHIAEMKNADKAQSLICPECGETNPGNFTSCWNCGNSLGD